MALFDYSTPASTAVLAAVLTAVLYTIYGVIYRLCLSPIAKFPGPKLAALTFWYEFYYDVVKRGRYTWEIKRMHGKYGPIVRINPYELHIDDPDYYDELYSGPLQKRDKWEWSAKMFGNPSSVFGTIAHDHHRLRRAAINPYFSKRSITNLEPTIRSLVDRLCERMREFGKKGEPVNLQVAYSALTTDIITDYCFAESYGCLEKPNFNAEWVETLMATSELGALLKQFGWLFPMMQAMPKWFVKMTNPQMMALLYFQETLHTRVVAIMRDNDRNTNEKRRPDRPTIIADLLNNPDLPPSEKTMTRLIEESETLVGAGTNTTAHMLKTTTYHLLANPPILNRLLEELTTAVPSPMDLAPLQQLEQLPYLTAVVNEGLRMSYGASTRLQRVSPDKPLRFRTWTIPPGTPVSMTSIFIHDNPTIFPSPHTFDPSRWLDASGKRLDKYLVSFSKGTRACAGMNLAYAEIYLTLAAVFRRLELELFETGWADVETVHDFFNPSARLDSKGVRVLVK